MLLQPDTPLFPHSEQSRELRRFFLIAEGISELVGTMFTVKYFAQASLPLLAASPPPHFTENMFNLTGVNR